MLIKHNNHHSKASEFKTTLLRAEQGRVLIGITKLHIHQITKLIEISSGTVHTFELHKMVNYSPLNLAADQIERHRKNGMAGTTIS